MLDHLRRLFEHIAWADTRALNALRTAPNANGSALALLSHVLGAEEVWLARLEQRTPELAVWPALSLADAERVLGSNAAALRTYVAGLSASDLEREIPYVNSAGQHFRSTIADILLHIALHGSYHRGQVALLVREGGGEPAPTDYIAYVRGTPAATRQSSLPAPSREPTRETAR